MLQMSPCASEKCSVEIGTPARWATSPMLRKRFTSSGVTFANEIPSLPQLMLRFYRRAPDSKTGRNFGAFLRSEEHTSELQSLMRISYAVLCLNIKNNLETEIHASLTRQHDDCIASRKGRNIR